MRRQKTLFTVIRDMVQQEVRFAIQSLLGSGSTRKPKAKTGRRRRRKARGKWRPGGPGRPPKAVSERAARKKAKSGRRRGPGRRPGSKNKK